MKIMVYATTRMKIVGHVLFALYFKFVYYTFGQLDEHVYFLNHVFED